MTNEELMNLVEREREREEEAESFPIQVWIPFPLQAEGEVGMTGVTLDIGELLVVWANHIEAESQNEAERLRYVAANYYPDNDLEDDDDQETPVQAAESRRYERRIEETINEHLTADTLLHVVLPRALREEFDSAPIVVPFGELLQKRADTYDELGMRANASTIRMIATKYFSGSSSRNRICYDLWLDDVDRHGRRKFELPEARA